MIKINSLKKNQTSTELMMTMMMIMMMMMIQVRELFDTGAMLYQDIQQSLSTSSVLCT